MFNKTYHINTVKGKIVEEFQYLKKCADSYILSRDACILEAITLNHNFTELQATRNYSGGIK